MKQKQNLYAALAFAALAAVAAPGTAAANSTANTTILNVVRVDYKDVSGQNSFAANASAKVTVNLVKTALNPSAAPDATGSILGVGAIPDLDRASGSTLNVLYALTATANGADDYNLKIANTPTNVRVETDGVTYSTLTFSGAQEALAPAKRVLGSAIPTRVVDANTLEFPGGALAGFEKNDIVVVDVAGVKQAFLVDEAKPGFAPTFSHVGGQAYSNADGDYTQEEVKGTLKLVAYANQSITVNAPGDTTVGGNNVAPAFTTTGVPTLGVPVGEMVLVKVSVSATTHTQEDGSVAFVLTATDSSDANPSTIAGLVSTFKAPKLEIKKEARNVTEGGSFGASATGNPQQVLEYRVTVTNAGGQASLVTVADAVPSYTTLLTHAGSYGAGNGTGAAGDLIAKLSDGISTVDLTMAGNDSEPQPLPANSGYGKATGVAADSPITFYLGDGSTNALGGKLPYCSNGTSATQATCAAPARWITEFTIRYQVRID